MSTEIPEQPSLKGSFIRPADVLLRTNETDPSEIGECHMGGFYPEDTTARRTETVVVSR